MVNKLSIYRSILLQSTYCTISFYKIHSVYVVTRIEARSERFDMFMHLDVNTEIYPMGEGQKFTMALATTLNLDGTPDTGYYTPVIFYRYQDKKLVPSNSSAIIQFRVDFFVLLLLFVKFTILYLYTLVRFMKVLFLCIKH